MKRRDFTLGTALASSALLPSMAWAQAEKFTPNSDYRVLDARAPVEAPANKVEVVEFFWYGCPHCNAFEPVLSAWVKKLPKHVAFKRVPVAFQDSFVPQQRLYYALEALGLVETLQAKVFAAIHAQKLDLSKAPAIVEWAVGQGVDRTKFTAAYESFSAASSATRAKQLADAYRIEGVPTLGVAGRFWTDEGMARSKERALRVVDSLVADVLAKRI